MTVKVGEGRNSMIQKYRIKIPKGFRDHLKILTARVPILTTLIGVFYGVLVLPLSRKKGLLIPLQAREESVKLVCIPDIYAVDCFHDIFVNEVYERYRKVKRGDTVIDVGAQIGMFTVKAAKKVGRSGLVIAIEPEETNLKVLRINVKMYQFEETVKVIPKALGAFKGKTKLIVSELSGTHKLGIYENPENPVAFIEVPIDTLDNISSQLNLARIDFLKIDAEGSEEDILRGAKESLKITKNLAIASYHYPQEKVEIQNFLRNVGFDIHEKGGIVYASSKLD